MDRKYERFKRAYKLELATISTNILHLDLALDDERTPLPCLTKLTTHTYSKVTARLDPPKI